MGVGPVVVNGGTLSAPATVTAYANPILATNDFGLAGTNNTATLTGTVDLNGGTRQITASANWLLSGVISNGSLTKTGIGSLALSGINTNSLGTNVNAGALSYLTLAAQPPAGTTSVAAGAALALGISGPNAFTAADVNNLFAGMATGNTANIVLDPAANVGIDTTNGNASFGPIAATSRGLVKVGLGIVDPDRQQSLHG